MAQGALACQGCGWQDLAASQSIGDDPSMRILLPVGRSVHAIIAGYLGLLSPLFIFAPFALLFGILALRDIKKNPKKGGKGRAIFGIAMGSIFTVLLLGFILLGLSQA